MRTSLPAFSIKSTPAVAVRFCPELLERSIFPPWSIATRISESLSRTSKVPLPDAAEAPPGCTTMLPPPLPPSSWISDASEVEPPLVIFTLPPTPLSASALPAPIKTLPLSPIRFDPLIIRIAPDLPPAETSPLVRLMDPLFAPLSLDFDATTIPPLL